jgi:hypothetical protein
MASSPPLGFRRASMAATSRATFSDPMLSRSRNPRRPGRWALDLVRGSLVCAAVAGCAVLSACASSSSSSVVRGPEADFALGPVPPSWHHIDVSDALVAYRDDTLDATTAVNARCGKDADDVPLEALRRHLFIYFTDREISHEEKLALDGREALKTVLRARLDGVQKAFVVYVLKKDGCVYDFMYISDPRTLEGGQAAFDRFVSGFRTIRR